MSVLAQMPKIRVILTVSKQFYLHKIVLNEVGACWDRTSNQLQTDGCRLLFPFPFKIISHSYLIMTEYMYTMLSLCIPNILVIYFHSPLTRLINSRCPDTVNFIAPVRPMLSKSLVKEKNLLYNVHILIFFHIFINN